MVGEPVYEAVAKCSKAAVTIKMCTGDDIITTRSISTQQFQILTNVTAVIITFVLAIVSDQSLIMVIFRSRF